MCSVGKCLNEIEYYTEKKNHNYKDKLYLLFIFLYVTDQTFKFNDIIIFFFFCKITMVGT